MTHKNKKRLFTYKADTIQLGRQVTKFKCGADEYKSALAGTLQRHTKPTLRANLCKEPASAKHQQQNIHHQRTRTTEKETQQVTGGFAIVGLEVVNINNVQAST